MMAPLFSVPEGPGTEDGPHECGQRDADRWADLFVCSRGRDEERSAVVPAKVRHPLREHTPVILSEVGRDNVRR